MWRWKPEPNSLKLAHQLLPKIAGSHGTPFSWSLSITRESGGRSKTYVVRFPANMVIVTNGTTLEVDKAGEDIFIRKCRVLKGDFEVVFEGTEFRLGENLFVRLGRTRRMQTVLCEFCEVRWEAWGSGETPQMAHEIVEKLELPATRLEVPSQALKGGNTNTIPFGNRHLALQLIRLYEDETTNASVASWIAN